MGVAAALCRERAVEPRALSMGEGVKALQRRLLRMGQFIPHVSPDDPDDLIPRAEIVATAPPGISELPDSGAVHEVKIPEGMLIPFGAGPLPALGIRVEAEVDTVLRLELRRSEYYGNFSPDRAIESLELPLAAGAGETLRVQFSTVLERAEYLTVVMLPAEGLLLRESRRRYPGILRLEHRVNEKVGKAALQQPDRGIPRLEFWLPERRPDDQLWAMTFDPMLEPYAAAYVGGGYDRPFIEANGWAVEAKKAGEAYIRFRWKKKQRISRLIVSMDGDFDHPLESVQLGHADRVSPFLPEKLEVLDEAGRLQASAEHIHMARWDHRFAVPLYSESITLRFPSLHGDVMSLYRVRAYQ